MIWQRLLLRYRYLIYVAIAIFCLFGAIAVHAALSELLMCTPLRSAAKKEKMNKN